MALGAHVELVGREGEVELLRRFVEQLPGGARAALVRGEPGIGKTALWRRAVMAAETAGIKVLATRCVAAEMPIALGGLFDLLDAAFSELTDELAEPQRRAIAVALGIEDPQVVPDSITLPRAVVAALRLLVARGPLLVAIDDVQSLDAASARVLAFALRRVGALPVGALVTLRGAKDALDPLDLAEAFGPDRLVELELGGLSSGALQHLVRLRLAVRLPRATLMRVHEASGGNPMFAVEFARLVASHDDAPPGAPLTMPSSLRQLVGERIARFPPEIRPLLELVAALERPTLPNLTQAFASTGGAEKLLSRAEGAEAVVVGEDDVVRFTHPLLASAVYHDATPQRRRALHGQAAALLTDLDQRARHLALATAAPDAGVASLLDEAAERAAARGTPDAAAELAERAQLLTPPLSIRERAARALAAARYLIEAAQAGRAVAVLDELLAGDVIGRARAEALQLRATIDPDGDATIALLESALENAGDDRCLRARILGQHAYGVALWRGDLRTGEKRAQEAVALAEKDADPVVLDATLRILGNIAALRGRPRADVMERAIALAADPSANAAGSTRSALGLHYCWSGDLRSARDLLEEELVSATHHGEKRRAFVLVKLAEAEWRAGDLDAAERHVAEPAEVFVDGGDAWGGAQALTLRALLAAIRGRTEESRRLAQEAISCEDEHHAKHLAVANRWVLGFLELSLDQPVRAHQALGPLPEALEALGVGEPGFIPALPDVVETLVMLGRLEEAEATLRRLEGQAITLQHRWATPAALRCRALLLLARGEANPALLSAEEAVAGFEAAGFPLDRGRALLVAGDALRRLGERRHAAEKLEAAKEVFSELGAALWLQRAEKELRRANPRRRSDRELTSSECRVAALVASGLTNREVAGQLFTTVSTVESHLSRIYRKAGVRSRTELARRVAEGELHLDDA